MPETDPTAIGPALPARRYYEMFRGVEAQEEPRIEGSAPTPIPEDLETAKQIIADLQRDKSGLEAKVALLEILSGDQEAQIEALLDDNAEKFQETITDPLTGVYNRRGLAYHYSRLQQQGHTLAMLAFDVVDFGRTNRRLGHDGGDRILQETTKILTAGGRQDDIIGRYGGDEFAAILILKPSEIDGLSKIERAKKAGERIVELFHDNEVVIDFNGNFPVTTEDLEKDADAQPLGLRFGAFVCGQHSFGLSLKMSDPKGPKQSPSTSQ